MKKLLKHFIPLWWINEYACDGCIKYGCTTVISVGLIIGTVINMFFSEHPETSIPFLLILLAIEIPTNFIVSYKTMKELS